MRPQLSVILPIHNEEESIEDVLARLTSTIRAIPVEAEIICVDDGSTDRSPELLAGTSGVQVVTLPRNCGYGATLKAGFEASRGNILATLDADRTYPPEELPRLLEALGDGVDMVVGNRFGRAGNEMEMLRCLGNRFYAWVVRMLFCRHVLDVCSGMRVMRRDFLERANYRSCSDDLDFALHLSLRAIRLRARVHEVPIGYDRRAGRSKLHILPHGIRFLLRIFRERLGGSEWRPQG